MELSLGLMEKFTKDNTYRMRNRAEEEWYMEMVRTTKGTGTKGDNTEEGNLKEKTARFSRAHLSTDSSELERY